MLYYRHSDTQFYKDPLVQKISNTSNWLFFNIVLSNGMNNLFMSSMGPFWKYKIMGRILNYKEIETTNLKSKFEVGVEVLFKSVINKHKFEIKISNLKSKLHVGAPPYLVCYYVWHMHCCLWHVISSFCYFNHPMICTLEWSGLEVVSYIYGWFA